MSANSRRLSRIELMRIRMRARNRPNNTVQNYWQPEHQEKAGAPEPADVSVEPNQAQLDASSTPAQSKLARIYPAHAPAHPLMRPGLRPAGGGESPDAGALSVAWQSINSSAGMWGMLMIIVSVLVWGAGLLIGFQTALAILMVICLVAAAVGLLTPALGIISIGMLSALDAMANIFLLTGGLLRYNTLNYWLLIVMLLSIPFVLRLKDINSRALEIFLLLLLLEITYSSGKSRGVQDVLNIGVTFGMVVYFARALKDELSLYWMGLATGVMAGLGGLVYYLQMNKLPYANPNDWTYFNLTALFAICMAYPFAVKLHKNRIFLLALAALNFAWIFLSASRGSILIAALAGAYLFLATRSVTWKTIMVVVAILIAGWVTANFAEQQSYTVSRIELLFNPDVSAKKRTSQRSVIAEAGLKIFQQNPMGIGTGGFAEESLDTGLLGSARPAHSAWIKVLAENGIPGIILMVAFIASFLATGLHNPKEGRWLFALFIAITLAGGFVAKEFRGKSLWFLVAGGIAMLHPQEMLESMGRKLKETDIDFRRRLWEIRFGRK